MEIAVLGDEEFLLGFRLAGVRRIVPVEEDSELEPNLREIIKDRSIGIVVIHNANMKKLDDDFRKALVESVEPVVIAIGRVEEVDLREKIKRAVGVDLWK